MPRLDGEHIYRRVSVRIHADEKVRALSRPQPCGLALFHELIFGEQTGIIPGLYRIGEAAFAEQLDWPLQGFREAWREVEGQGLVQADWKARLIWVPKAIRHNIPASPNVVLSWRDAWDLLPECELKAKAKASLKAFLKAYSEHYAKAFDKATAKVAPKLGKPSDEPSGKASSNQEQEQEILDPDLVARDGGTGEENSQPVNSGITPPTIPESISQSDRLQVQRLFAEGKAEEARSLLADATRRNRSKEGEKTKLSEVAP